jgi:enoyl-CoA hydratase/carnithine racemase
MKWIEAFTEDRVRILKLNHGVPNAINFELLGELHVSLEEIKNDPGIGALVLTSANEKFFCIGFDIPELYTQDVSAFEKFFHFFNEVCIQLYTLPKPTLAALTGHAIAGGFILASCCDYRYMASGKKFCALTEINLGVPVPYFSDLVLRQLVGDRRATEIMYTGALVTSEEAFRIGFVDALFEPGQLMKEALTKAGTLGALPSPAFQAIKHNRTSEIAQKGRDYLDTDVRNFLTFWYSPDARKRLEEAMEKF